MKRIEVTIDDIALELNISVSTVSRALNNHPRISDATKHKVFKKAKELGYKPGMADYRKHLIVPGKFIALVCPHLNSKVYRTAFEKLQHLFLPKGILVGTFLSENSEDEEKKIINKLLEIKPTAVIVSAASEVTDYDHYDKLITAGIPLVCFNRVNVDYPTPKIVADNYQGAFNAADRMIKSGAQRIGVILGNRFCPINEEIQKGIVRAVQQAGRKVDMQYIVNCSLEEQAVEHAVEYLYSLPEAPDAMIVARPQIALTLIAKLKERNLSTPTDVPIVAFGSFEYNKYITPSISTVEVDAGQMGDELAAKVEELLQEPDSIITHTTIVPTELIVRGTSFR